MGGVMLLMIAFCGKSVLRLHGSGGLIQLGDEGSELLRLIPLVLDNVGGGLGGEAAARSSAWRKNAM